MGTWAVDAFGNDNACDWCYDLEGTEDHSLVVAALEAVLNSETDYIEAPVAEAALAAIEVIARLQGNGGERNPYSEPVDIWVKAHPIRPSAKIVQQAHRVIERVLAEGSELNELWRESDEYDAWRLSVAELRSRVV